jgi:hypothetical protein
MDGHAGEASGRAVSPWLSSEHMGLPVMIPDVRFMSTLGQQALSRSGAERSTWPPS